jgi:hypothetical protein
VTRLLADLLNLKNYWVGQYFEGTLKLKQLDLASRYQKLKINILMCYVARDEIMISEIVYLLVTAGLRPRDAGRRGSVVVKPGGSLCKLTNQA